MSRARPRGADTRHLRPARPIARRQAASGTRPAQPPRQPLGARLRASAKPKRRHRLERPGRNPAGNRPPPHPNQNQRAQTPACQCKKTARNAAQSPPFRQPENDGDCGLHQRRQIHPVQPPHQIRRVRQRPTVRHARHHRAAALPCPRSQHHPQRHGGLCAGFAASAGFRLFRHAGRNRAGRRAAAYRGCARPRTRTQNPRCERGVSGNQSR